MNINKDTIQGKWREIKGEVQKTWGKLTDDELEQTKGDAKAIAGLIQQRYGNSKEANGKKLSDIFQRFEKTKDSAVGKIKSGLKDKH